MVYCDTSEQGKHQQAESPEGDCDFDYQSGACVTSEKHEGGQ
jgi:hypothetical protein